MKIRESLQYQFKFGCIHFSDLPWLRVIQGSPVLRFDGGKGHIRVMSTEIWPNLTLSRVLGKFRIPFKIIMRVFGDCQ